MNEKKVNPLLKVLDKVDNILSKFEGVMLALGIIFMALVTILAVIFRFVFNDALIVADELNMIFIVIVTFAGLSYAARNGRHIRMSAIYDAFPTKGRKFIMICISFTTSIFMFLLAKYSYEYIIEVYESGRILPVLGIHVFYVYLLVPIGFTVTGLQYFFTVIKNIRESDIYLSTNVKDGYSDCKNDIEV